MKAINIKNKIENSKFINSFLNVSIFNVYIFGYFLRFLEIFNRVEDEGTVELKVQLKMGRS
jgi:hypothetical protein